MNNNATINYASVIGGTANTASGWYSTAANFHTTTAAFAQTTFGAYNLPKGSEDATAWVTTDPLFTIGNGTGGGASRSNALMLLKDSKLGVGNIIPNEQLTVGGVTSLLETAAPSLTANYGKIYVKSADSKLYFMDDAGAEVQLGAPLSIAADSLNFTDFSDALVLDASTDISATAQTCFQSQRL